MKRQFLMGLVYCALCVIILVGMKLVAGKHSAFLDHTNEPQYECTPECWP